MIPIKPLQNFTTEHVGFCAVHLQVYDEAPLAIDSLSTHFACVMDERSLRS